MFANIYNLLSNTYNYIDSGIRNNPIISSTIPVLYGFLTSSLFSSNKQLEYIKPFFTSIYDTLNKKNDLINNKNQIINMGCTEAKEQENPAPKKKQAIPKKVRDAVWVKYHNNNDVGNCYCCDKSVERYNCGWQAAHVHSENMGGQVTVDNLRVACSGCNMSMGNQNLYAYIRDKNLNGEGRNNVRSYFKKNPSQINSKRTNNWGNNKKKALEAKKNNNNTNNTNNTNNKNKNWIDEWI